MLEVRVYQDEERLSPHENWELPRLFDLIKINISLAACSSQVRKRDDGWLEMERAISESPSLTHSHTKSEVERK